MPDHWPLLAPAAAEPVVPLSTAPTFSVVIATYQSAATLPDALDSVLTQTVPPMEVVICDDGSTDDTAAVLDRFAGRVYVLRQPNGGEGSAKNAAVRAARGEFVVVLDADDVFLPERLEAFAWSICRRPDLDVLVSDALLEVGGAVVGRAYHADWPFPVHDQRAAILSRNFVLGLAAVRRSRWLAVGGFDEDLSRTADWDFFLRLVLGGARVGLVDVPLARYRLSAAGLSSARQELVRARIQVLERAARRADLPRPERDIVRRALIEQRRQLRFRLARDALLASAHAGTRPKLDVRRLAAVALVASDASMPQRLALGAAAIVPAWAATRWASRSPGTEIGTGRIVGPAGPPADTGLPDGETERLTPVCWLRGLTLRRGAPPLRLPILPAGLLGPPDRAIAEITGDPAVGASPPDRPPADAAAVRLQRAGAVLRWTDPVVVAGRGALVRQARSAGRAAAAAIRPDELTLSRVGSWWQGTPGQRLLRRVPGAHLLPLPSARLEDVAFWQGVRQATTTDRWAALRGSYVCLAYHRVAGEMRPGEERYDVAPRRFARNAAILRLLRWRPLTPAELLGFHRGAGVALRRRFVLTLDDGYVDAVRAAVSAARLRPHVYVPTAEVGRHPGWASGAPLADWGELAAACRAGVLVGAHGRVHRPLTQLPTDQVAADLTTALTELRSRLPLSVPFLAYPNGRHDHETRQATIGSGYSAAWTTMTGRNGVGVDRYCLRRISIKDWDGPLSFLWKVVTGQDVPPIVEIVSRWRWKRRVGRQEARRGPVPT